MHVRILEIPLYPSYQSQSHALINNTDKIINLLTSNCSNGVKDLLAIRVHFNCVHDQN